MSDNAPLKLQALTALAIQKIDPGAADWEKQMRQVIARGHTAAWLAATAERLGVPVNSPLLSRQRLSKAERAEIAGVVEKQLTYLRGFKDKLPDMSPQAIAARAAMYAGPVKQTFLTTRWGDWDIPDRLLPGNQECRSNCRCEISVKDNGDGTGTLTRTLHAENNCDECPPLAGEYQIERRQAA